MLKSAGCGTGAGVPQPVGDQERSREIVALKEEGKWLPESSPPQGTKPDQEVNQGVGVREESRERAGIRQREHQPHQETPSDSMGEALPNRGREETGTFAVSSLSGESGRVQKSGRFGG